MTESLATMGANHAGEAKRKRAKIRKKLETIRIKKEEAAAAK